MKRLTNHSIDPVDARRQLNDYQVLLAAKPELSERGDILPFFRANPDLCLLFSHYEPLTKLPLRRRVQREGSRRSGVL